MEQRVQQEQRVGGLGGHAGYPADVQVGPARAVQEVEVEEDRLAVAGQAGRNATLHLVEVQGLVAVLPPGAEGRQPRERRDEYFGLEACGHDLSGNGGVDRQHALVDQEDVGVERGALVPGPGVLDDARDPHHPPPRHVRVDDHRVVELEVRVG